MLILMLVALAIPLAIPVFAEDQQMRPIPGWKREASGPWLHSGYGGYGASSSGNST